jgi:hypothetical protein
MLMQKRTQFLAEEGKRVIAVFRAKHYKDKYLAQYNACVGGGEYRDDEASGDDPKVSKYKPAVEEGMNCMLRASISRMNYLKRKHNYLQIGARTPLVQLIRAQMARNVYQKARNAKFEAGNRQQLACLMMATICRQSYYERKLEFAELDVIHAANERMEIYEKSSTEFMLHLEDQERKAAEERITMRKEEEYADAMKDSQFLEGLGKQKESVFMTASDNRRKAANAMQKLNEAAGDAAGLDEELAQNEEAIQLGAHRKVQEVLVAALPESLKECGTCALIRCPEVTDNQLVAQPLQPFPEKFDDLGTMRRYIYSTNKIYREKHPNVKKKSKAELDEQFAGTFGDTPAETETNDEEQELSEGDAEDATAESVDNETYDPVPAHFATGASLLACIRCGLSFT